MGSFSALTWNHNHVMSDKHHTSICYITTSTETIIVQYPTDTRATWKPETSITENGLIGHCHRIKHTKRKIIIFQQVRIGMHDIGFFAYIWYADILQLIWPIINTDTDIYVCFFPTPNCRDHKFFSVVEFTYSIFMQTLTMLAHQQMQAKMH